jgi:hypothetical protein
MSVGRRVRYVGPTVSRSLLSLAVAFVLLGLVMGLVLALWSDLEAQSYWLAVAWSALGYTLSFYLVRTVARLLGKLGSRGMPSASIFR